jgi:ubiquinone biosynthesis protein UbiJ
VFDGRELAEAVPSGEMRIEGDRGLAERFLGLYMQHDRDAAPG